MRASTCAAILFALACPAFAQDEVKQSETELYVQTSGGAVAVCGLSFTIAYIDRTYRHGDPAGVNGSLGWIESASTGVAAFLHLKGFDTINGSRVLTPFQVFRGFVVIEGRSVIPTKTIKGEEPTDFDALYSFEDTIAITNAMVGKKRFAIGFNREADGGIDTTLPLDIRDPNPTNVQSFADCMLPLFNRAKAKANER
jgi:hypothetical protein